MNSKKIAEKIFFFPHSYLRDRQLDTVKSWKVDQVLNPELAHERVGDQVSKEDSLKPAVKLKWKQKVPLLNLKFRPKGLPREVAVYVWGAIVSHGLFIVDLDNPFSLTGYNLRAFFIYRFFIRKFLLSKRCLSIRCMSIACRNSLKLLLGEKVFEKATVVYPVMNQKPICDFTKKESVNFLFISTQFEIKAGKEVLLAFKTAAKTNENIHLDVITHLPTFFKEEKYTHPRIRFHSATLSREKIYSEYMSHCDVLIVPSLAESFGLVFLEALAHSMAIIATDVYAIREMVTTGYNGFLLTPPISTWNGFLPSVHQYNWKSFKQRVVQLDTSEFIGELVNSIDFYAKNREILNVARQNSAKIFSDKFSFKKENYSL